MSELYCHICSKPYRITGFKSKTIEWCTCRERIAELENDLSEAMDSHRKMGADLHTSLKRIAELEDMATIKRIAELEAVAWELADPTITLPRKYELKKWLLENSDGGEHREWVLRHVRAAGYLQERGDE